MAISTGDICTDAMDAIIARAQLGVGTELDCQNLCFLFKKKWELDGADIRTDFQDMIDWFSTQSWVGDNGLRVKARWWNQTINITTQPDYASTAEYTGQSTGA